MLWAPDKLSLDCWAPLDKIFKAASAQPVLIFEKNWLFSYDHFESLNLQQKWLFMKQSTGGQPVRRQGSGAGSGKDSLAICNQQSCIFQRRQSLTNNCHILLAICNQQSSIFQRRPSLTNNCHHISCCKNSHLSLWRLPSSLRQTLGFSQQNWTQR